MIGRRHPRIQRVRRLSGRRTARASEGAYVIDGPVLLAEAVAAGVEIEEVLAEPDAPTEPLAAAARAGARTTEVAPGVLAWATSTVTPQGVAAVARRRPCSIDAAMAMAAAGPLVVVLVDVADPGNAGTLLRAAEASGAVAVLFCGTSVDPYNPKCVRASAGALFHVAVAEEGEPLPVLARLGEASVWRAATVVRGGAPLGAARLDPPLALVLGSEAHGLAPAVVHEVDEQVTVPMVGRGESLNVAMAGTVLCIEALRRRMRSSGDE